MFGRGHSYKGNRISPLQMVILLLLWKRPMYGYEVLKELRERFDPVWVPKTGSIYPAIKRLEEHGLVRSEKVDGTDHYIITEVGKQWVEEEFRRSPRDARLLIRYLEIIDKAVAEVMPPRPGEERWSPFREMFEEEDTGREKRVQRLKAARARLAQHIEEIDRELQELDPEDKDQQGGKAQ